MEPELKALEDKVSQLVDLCQRLRAENVRLRQEVATEQSAKRALHDKIDSAKDRLERLLEQIPEEAV